MNIGIRRQKSQKRLSVGGDCNRPLPNNTTSFDDIKISVMMLNIVDQKQARHSKISASFSSAPFLQGLVII